MIQTLTLHQRSVREFYRFLRLFHPMQKLSAAQQRQVQDITKIIADSSSKQSPLLEGRVSIGAMEVIEESPEIIRLASGPVIAYGYSLPTAIIQFNLDVVQKQRECDTGRIDPSEELPLYCGNHKNRGFADFGLIVTHTQPIKTYRILKNRQVVSTNVRGKYAGYAPGKIFGKLDCDSGVLMKREYRVFFHCWEDAIREGYTPCKNCVPERD